MDWNILDRNAHPAIVFFSVFFNSDTPTDSESPGDLTHVIDSTRSRASQSNAASGHTIDTASRSTPTVGEVEQNTHTLTNKDTQRETREHA